ncbi:MAG: galactokinase [Actinomycetota bacterium]|nr:galactokinase [Actinomycetota bacterium]
MIISRTPLRISLGGGGTDLPSFYENHGGGFLVAAAIDKYVYLALHKNFEEKYLLKYSEIENVENLEQIRHPMIREVLRDLGAPTGVEITSIADIPAGTGLGSSGSFGVGLIKALTMYQRRVFSNEWIAERACEIEIDHLKEPVGKQDQYIAAIGGLTAFEFKPDGKVEVTPVNMSETNRRDFEESLILFFTGVRRSASDELRTMAKEATSMTSTSENLKAVREAGYRAFQTLVDGAIDDFGRQLNEQWKLKFHRQPSEIHNWVDSVIDDGIHAGAFGGKLIGAGGGGFLLFSTDKKAKLRAALKTHNLIEVPIAIDYEGSSTIKGW